MWKNKRFVKEQSILSGLKGNHTDNQARSLMIIAIQRKTLICVQSAPSMLDCVIKFLDKDLRKTVT